jgi:type IV pilus assembly protein PilW
MNTMGRCTKGFTLIELMIAMVVSGIVMAAIYAAYEMQVRSQITNQALVDMQQEMRAAMLIMERDLRMAGYDPTENAGAEITEIRANRMAFTMDVAGGNTDGIDNDNDGVVDEADEAGFSDGDLDDGNEVIRYVHEIDAEGTPYLGRSMGGGAVSPVAYNIDALNFVFLDEDGNPTADRTQIRAVAITMVGRSGKDVPVLFFKQQDNTVYRNQQGDVILAAPNDDFRRMMLSTVVKCRNL